MDLSLLMAGNTENDLLYLLHAVAHMMRIRFDQYARAWGMTRAQCVILLHLNRTPGMTQNEMACLCEIEPITVARLVDRLEAGKLVERRPDPSDRRINRLHLLPAAKPIVDRLLVSRDYAFEALVGDLSPEKLQGAVDVLKHMKQRLASSDAGLFSEPKDKRE